MKTISRMWSEYEERPELKWNRAARLIDGSVSQDNRLSLGPVPTLALAGLGDPPAPDHHGPLPCIGGRA